MEMILAFLLGMCSGFIGGFSTGGGLVSIPGLIFLGLPPATAIATTRLSALSSGVTAVLRFRKDNLVQFKMIAPLIPLAIFAGIAGSEILLSIDQDLLTTLVGVLLLLLVPFLLFKKDLGVIKKHRGNAFKYAGYFVIFLVLVYSAFFGGGAGMFAVYAFIYFFGMSVIQANANATVLNIFTVLTAIIFYAGSGSIRFDLGIPLMIGSAIGGYLGASSAVKKGDAFVKVAFVIIIVISSIKLIFFS